jgi:two-component system response regulator
MLNNPNKLSFIIADDDTEDQILIQEAIKSIDITIEYTSVFNGSQLLDLLLKRGAYKDNLQCRPDAIILDLNMPVLDGLSALRQIRGHKELREIPVFILYTLRKDDYSTQCRALGVSGMYVKPNTADELKTILKEIYAICGGKLMAVTLKNDRQSSSSMSARR